MQSIQDIKVRHILGFLILPIIGAIIASRAVWETKAGDIVTSIKPAWGDLLVHLRAITFFFEQGGVPHESYLLAGKPVGYAYMSDFISTLLLRLDVPLALSIAIPTIILASLTLILIQQFTYVLTRSLLTSILAALLFLGFGGLQAFYTIPEFLNSSKSFTETLQGLPHDISYWPDQKMYITNMFVMMLHQRGYLLGFPIFLLLLWSAYGVLVQKKKWPLVPFTALGVLLAFIHPHTWAASLLILPSWALIAWSMKERTYSRQEVFLLISILLFVFVGGFAMVKSLQPKAGAAYLGFAPGWLEPSAAWPIFWLRNLGLHVPLAIAGAFMFQKTKKPLGALLVASFVPFFAANVFQFAPWIWDNTKMMAPMWVIMCIANAALLQHFFRKSVLYKVLASVAVIVLIASGTLTIARIFTYTDRPWVLGSADGRAIAKAIQMHTEPDAVVIQALNADSPTFVFAGRPSLAAYEGWLWSNGWDGQYEDRVRAIQNVYRGQNDANTIIEQYNVKGIVVGPPEIQKGADVRWLDATFEKIQISPKTTLYLTNQ